MKNNHKMLPRTKTVFTICLVACVVILSPLIWSKIKPNPPYEIRTNIQEGPAREFIINELAQKGIKYEITKDNSIKYDSTQEKAVEKIINNFANRPATLVKGSHFADKYSELMDNYKVEYIKIQSETNDMYAFSYTRNFTNIVQNQVDTEFKKIVEQQSQE